MEILYILLALLIFSFMIFMHEWGHYLVARMCGVGINEFSIGMGPKIIAWKSKKYGTQFTIRLFPIGGFVSMLGEDEAPESKKYAEERHESKFSFSLTETEPIVEESDEQPVIEKQQPEVEPLFDEPVSEKKESTDDLEGNPHAYCNKKVWQRMLICVAGPLVNILVGFVCMLVVVLLAKSCPSNVIAKFQDNSKSNTCIVLEDGAMSGTLEVGDQIIKVGKTNVHTGNEVVYEIMYHAVKPIDVTVIRNGEKVVIKNVVFPVTTDEKTEASFADYDFFVLAEPKNFSNIMKHAYFQSVSTVKMILDSLGGMLSGRFGIKAVSGPVGVTQTIANAAKTSFFSLMYLVTVVTINLGVMNLLPFPALDGSKLVFLFVELVRGKPVSKSVEGYIHLAGILVLFAFMILITIKDVIGLF